MPYLERNKKKYKKPNTKRETDRKRIYQSSEWVRLRQAYLMEHPLCEICLALGKTTPAEDVHHKDSFLNYSGYMQQVKAYDYNNLMSLCKQHHSELHAGGRSTFGFDMDAYLKAKKEGEF